MISMSLARRLSAIVLAFCCSGAALAQTWPARPIRIIVPFGAGTTADIIARVIGVNLSKELGQQVIVDDKPGAGGTIGGAEAARAAPDGYTLVLGTVASHGVGPLTMQNVTYDPVKNFQAITLIANVPSLIAVHNSVPAKRRRSSLPSSRPIPATTSPPPGRAPPRISRANPSARSSASTSCTCPTRRRDRASPTPCPARSR